MKTMEKNKKLAAAFLSIILGVQTFYPGVAYALTSGPAQPEMQAFKAAGMNDMVDLFTGDLKYNIPLMDVGGYPVNLSYSSGTTMEDEASWVGEGWSLNPGTVNRTLRGLPDDFNGKKKENYNNDQIDQIEKTYSKKEFKKVGGTLTLKPSIFAWEFGSASMKFNVYKDNYFGMGASIGTSVSFSLAKNTATPLTVGIGINSDVRDGVDINPSVGVSASMDESGESNSVGLSAGLHYNTRAGLKSVSLGLSYNPTSDPNTNYDFSGVKYFGQTHNPKIGYNGSNEGFTFSLDLGPSLFGGYIGIGGAGYVYRETIQDKGRPVKVPAFGYMNYLDGRKDINSLIDFNREKDGVFITSAPAIPVPVCTNDFFTATAQTGSQQFRPHFGGNYVVFDKQTSNTSFNLNGGVTLGAPWLFKGGARVDWTNGESRTNKWTSGNHFLNVAEANFTNPTADEPIYFKQVGEKTSLDQDFVGTIAGLKTTSVRISSSSAMSSVRSRENGTENLLTAMRINKRQKRYYPFSYLDAVQADKYALDKKIKTTNPSNGTVTPLDRVSGTLRKAHHMSEVTVTDNEGKRMVYGIPVYNAETSEYSFSIGHPSTDLSAVRRSGLVSMGSGASPDNRLGRDWLYSKETTPSYVTSFLLTGILSPDYVDLTKDGITDDDLGTAVKFNYSKVTDDYRWRAPYEQSKANYNEGLMSDPKDDKANFVYGKKEIWNLYSIESKTMIAIFETSNREDGLGVIDENGGRNSNTKLKKIDKIRLYSKAEWLKSPSTAVPIKTVGFVYDYSLYPNVPNNTGANTTQNALKGKLTLKKLYFTFGSNGRGATNPYEFFYNTSSVLDGTGFSPPPGSEFTHEAAEEYATKQSDRWGTYKPSWYNPSHLENGEYPYALQKSNPPISYMWGEWFDDLLDNIASKWQLSKIITPTFSTIEVAYECDDYAYVQNRWAMQMFMVSDALLDDSPSGLINANTLVVRLPYIANRIEKPLNSEDFRNTYLKDMDKIFYKMYVDLDNSGHYEYVNGYAEILRDECTVDDIDHSIAYIKLKPGKNPISRAAWQMIKADLPQYCYDNYDNSDVSSDFEAAIRSMLQSIVNLREIARPFEKMAEKKYFANRFDPQKSMVRLCNQTGFKNGGGTRVRSLKMSDSWDQMAVANGALHAGVSSTYSQSYKYTKMGDNGKLISSGVAAYEPMIGNEENPFHEPIPFTEKIHWSADKYHYIEKPFCESYFPAASVGYSKVTVTSLGSDETPETGYIENEFYTAKDFPTIVDNMVKDQVNYENSLILRLFTSRSINRLANSQGFKVELNDMHGKQKSVKVFGKGGTPISSTEYFYNVKDENAELKELSNEVPVLKTNTNDQTINEIETRTVATDVDVVTDVRESYNDNTGSSVGGYFGSTCYLWFCFPYLAVIPNVQTTTDTYRSVSAVKVINRFGVIKKIRTMQNGSSTTAENLLYDEMTGEVLLTKNENQYGDPTYAFSYPAYMIDDYAGMGAAYRNLGITYEHLTTNSSGLINTGLYDTYLFPGDVLGAVNSDKMGWVIRSGDGSLRLINEEGNFITDANGPYMVLRSGRRNMMTSGAGSIVCMKNPIVGNQLVLTEDRNILDAKAVAYNEKWSVPVYSTEESNTDQQCITIYPITDPLGTDATNYSTFYKDYDVSTGFPEGTFTSCPDAFCAQTMRQPDHSQLWSGIKRSFLNFGDALPATPGVTVISAKISFYNDGIIHKGQNTSWLQRVNESKTCSNIMDFYTEPSMTLANRKLIPTLSNNSDYTNLDITGMFNDWFVNRDISTFRVGLKLVSEFLPTSINQIVEMNFGGASAYTPTHRPKLEICYIDPSTTHCVSPVDKVINPYYKAVLGNWRPQINYVYRVNRNQDAVNTIQPGGTDIRHKGYYSVFGLFWDFSSGTLGSAFDVNNPGQLTDRQSRWIWSNQAVYFDQKGNEVENVDALKRYSSNLFGYKESVVTATAVNSRHNEIMFDGFEDYDFDLNSAAQPCPIKQFDWGLVKNGNDWTGPGVAISPDKSHTGKNSLHLTGNVDISRSQGSAVPVATSNILGYDAQGRYKLLANELADGFAPVNGKQYLLSFWVHDGVENTNNTNQLGVFVNNTAVQSQLLQNLSVVEGWKKIEIPFTGGSSGVILGLHPTGSNIYIDDIRIIPYNGQMNSYIYDNTTLRLMAQLDENNFATLYEYDEEGTPIRVKKETERGIMTLKENRQSYRNRPQ